MDPTGRNSHVMDLTFVKLHLIYIKTPFSFITKSDLCNEAKVSVIFRVKPTESHVLQTEEIFMRRNSSATVLKYQE